MDPIKIIRPSHLAQSEPTGVVFIPFEGFNPRIINGRGMADWKLAEDLPPFSRREGILEYMANRRDLARRIIEYREHTFPEVLMNLELKAYMENYKRKSLSGGLGV